MHSLHSARSRNPVAKLCALPQWAWPFSQPVDLQRYKDYLRVISQPMDLGTVQNKLDTWQYNTPKEFEHDIRLIFANCRRYNAADQEVVVMGNTLEVSEPLMTQLPLRARHLGRFACMSCRQPSSGQIWAACALPCQVQDGGPVLIASATVSSALLLALAGCCCRCKCF